MLRQPLVLMGTVLFLGSIAVAQEEVNVRPRYLTPEEKAQDLDSSNLPTFYVWECRPDIAGFTDPAPVTSRFPTESEQTQGVLYAWPSYGAQMPELTELIRNSIGNAETTVMVPSTLIQSQAITTLRSRGFSDDDLAQINWYPVPLQFSGPNTSLDIWIRDFGPEILVTPDGLFQFVDMGYYSGAGNCTSPPGRPNSDVSPTLFASVFGGGVDVFRPQLRTEGGNLQTDGLGTCVHMRRDLLGPNGNCFSRWCYTQDQLDAVYGNFFNCGVITLESLHSDPGPVTAVSKTVIDHVDMFMTFLSPTKILLGQSDPEDAAFDPDNAAILDANADTLTNAGYNVVRIPQPRRYCAVSRASCITNPGDARECGPGLDRVWATYANSIRVGNQMMVPVYHDVPASLQDAIAAQEVQALTIYQQELDNEFGPGAVQVVPIEADRMINCQGALHCISMTYGPPAMQ
jgi:agmatine/peptidylarginine deiminase